LRHFTKWIYCGPPNGTIGFLKKKKKKKKERKKKRERKRVYESKCLLGVAAKTQKRKFSQVSELLFMQ
jgi:hypothetical protein